MLEPNQVMGNDGGAVCCRQALKSVYEIQPLDELLRWIGGPR